ncbi:MAG: squalene/phytoene synthase family protein [Planctomycetes bacterium]|nr:squalene/phytoene synthase family protein [Planctomycetota bacterium]
MNGDGAAAAAGIRAAAHSNFSLAFAALPRERRRGLTAIYAFCRVADDAVDEAKDAGTARARLAEWAVELDRVAQGTPRTAVGKELRFAVDRFGVDLRHLQALLRGVAMDLEPKGHATLAELEHYCHLVAGEVGLACLPVFGVHGPEAERYAGRLGVALQLTNVLRDLRADAAQGRIYLPRDLLAACGVDAAWLRGGGPPTAYAPDGPLDRAVARVAARAREHFAAAAAARPRQAGRALVAAEVMAAVYRELLERVAARGGAIAMDDAPRVPQWRKLWLLARTVARGHA